MTAKAKELIEAVANGADPRHLLEALVPSDVMEKMNALAQAMKAVLITNTPTSGSTTYVFPHGRDAMSFIDAVRGGHYGKAYRGLEQGPNDKTLVFTNK